VTNIPNFKLSNLKHINKSSSKKFCFLAFLDNSKSQNKNFITSYMSSKTRIQIINDPFVYIYPVEKISTFIRQFDAINKVG